MTLWYGNVNGIFDKMLLALYSKGIFYAGHLLCIKYILCLQHVENEFSYNEAWHMFIVYVAHAQR